MASIDFTQLSFASASWQTDCARMGCSESFVWNSVGFPGFPRQTSSVVIEWEPVAALRGNAFRYFIYEANSCCLNFIKSDTLSFVRRCCLAGFWVLNLKC